MPALIVIVPPGRLPRLDSEVSVVSRAVLIAVAGAPGVLEVLAEPEPEDDEELLDDDDVELPDGFNTCSTNDEISVLTRCKAAWLAMLAKPFPKLVSAWAIPLINAAFAEVTAD